MTKDTFECDYCENRARITSFVTSEDLDRNDVEETDPDHLCFECFCEHYDRGRDEYPADELFTESE